MEWITLKSHTVRSTHRSYIYVSTQLKTGKPNGCVMSKSVLHTSSYSAQGPELQLLHISSLVRSQPVLNSRFVTIGTCQVWIWGVKRRKKARRISFKRKAVLTTKRRQENVHIIKQTKRRYCTPVICKTQNY